MSGDAQPSTEKCIMIKTTTLNHVAVRVTDVDKAKHFYENVVGLRKIPRPKINIPGE